jgi:hypothetical protein
VERLNKRVDELLVELGCSAPEEVQLVVSRGGAVLAVSCLDRARRIELDEALTNALLHRGATWDV